ncbi:MAG: GIY-YIG nuclease family protein, partial [Gemmatimonadota bacterium]
HRHERKAHPHLRREDEGAAVAVLIGATLAACISYQLLIEIARPLRCAIGRLGVFDFPAGCYLYTGSARRGLDARIARHLRGDKRLHWHIDYLLAAPGVRIVDVFRSARAECALNRSVRGSVPCAGFGASDCRAGCGAHLKFLG